jgi:anti-sigma factor RsiW
MTCEWREKLDVYIDGELPQPEMAQVAAHLHSCPSCASDALGRMQMKRSIHITATNAFVPSAEFRDKVAKTTGVSRRVYVRWLPAVALAAVTALTVVALAFWPRHSGHPDVFAEVADVHVATLASVNPVDVISTDRHTVKPWFEGKLPFTFDLPELQNTDFRLIGGRMAYIAQSPGAQLLFAIRKHQISIFVFQERDNFAGLGPNPSLSHNLAFNLESWTDRGLRYVVISDASSADVQALSNLLRSAEQ